MTHGCYYCPPGESPSLYDCKLLPQIGLDVQATILATNSRTVITQTFVNPSLTEAILEVFYSFPLYENSSIVGLNCRVGDRVVKGVVESKEKAIHIYQEAKSKGKTAAILDRSQNAADVFSTRLGNVPAGETVVMEITLVQELIQDAQVDGVRYMVPVGIAPRYGAGTGEPDPPGGLMLKTEIRVDIIMEKGSHIRNIRSPSHPIQIDLGRASHMSESTFESCYAAVKLCENIILHEDFVLTVNADKHDLPFAFLETHPTLPNQQALMISLVPKFSLPPDASEIVFVIDRSGSMDGKIRTLRSALELFLKSVPLGVPFNIVSFGSSHKSLWPRSKVSSEESLAQALSHTRKINADMGGTEILRALQAAVKNRYKDKLLEVLENSTRFFTLGIGNSVSHALVNGISRAGKGFSQTVTKNEDLNKTVIRMLKGSLMPRLFKSRLEMKLPRLDEEYVNVEWPNVEMVQAEPAAEPTSFFNQEHKEEKDVVDLRQPLPKLSIPHILQAPTDLPALFPFIRSNIYVLLLHDSTSFPKAITLRAESKHGPMELEIPIQDIGKGETLHQLAAKKSMTELEESRGWIHFAKDAQGEPIMSQCGSRMDELVQQECERLGVRYQIAGKHCSFVAMLEDDLAGYESALNDTNNIPSHEDTRFRSAREETNCVEESESDEDMGFICATPLNAEVAAFDPGLSPTSSAGSISPSVGPSGSRSMAVSYKKARGAAQFCRAASSDEEDVQDDDDDNRDDNTSIRSLTFATKTPLQKIIILQAFGGYRRFNDELLEILGLDPDTMHSSIDDYCKMKKRNLAELPKEWLDILATALVGHFLEQKAFDSQDEWELVKMKADDWLQRQVRAVVPGDDAFVMRLIELCGSFF
ncbi:hypothetical protein N7523_010975 [Penicillium sp. IBT 18751x]|nr:hypothetical protein N7523_010975 [Penicillium sp. IBT 18751x]